METKSYSPDLFAHLIQVRRAAEQERDSYESSEAVLEIVKQVEAQLPEALRSAILNYKEASVSWISCDTARLRAAACRVLTRRTGMLCTSEADGYITTFMFKPC